MEKISAPWSNSNADAKRGRGYLFLTVILFRPRKSMKGRRVLSFFSTKKNPAPRGDVALQRFAFWFGDAI